MMEAVNSPEMSVSICQITWHSIPEDSHLQTHTYENLKNHPETGAFQNILCKVYNVWALPFHFYH
jgi:hypothetical protein